MYIQCNQDELNLFERISKVAGQLNVSCYLIGGFVRDKIIGRPTKDADIVCTGDGIALAHAVAQTYRPALNVSFFKNFGTAQFKIDGFDVEFVGARKESYRSDSRKPDVTEGTIEDDQLRRDFTINALAISLNEKDFGKLSDPFNGLGDLSTKIIRTPLEPGITFSDDPLRMMRCIRFAAQLGFAIPDNIFNAIIENKHRLKIISQERITDEFNKIMLTARPSTGLDLLFKSGLLTEFFPQFTDLHGVEIIKGLGHKDNFYHTLPATRRFEEGHGWTFHGHEAVGEKMTPRIFKQLKLPQNEKMKYVAKLVLLHLRPISLTKENITDSAIRRLLFDAGDDLEDLMILCESDITSKNKLKVKRYLENFELVKQRLKEVEEKDKIRHWQPPIDGADIMKVFNLTPCREVGAIKTAVREAILDGIIANDHDAAYTYMLTIAAGMGLAPAI
jgi:poly(A) polymerase